MAPGEVETLGVQSSSFFPQGEVENWKLSPTLCLAKEGSWGKYLPISSNDGFALYTLFKPGFNSMWTVNFQMFKLGLEKAEESEIKLPTSVESSKKQENSRRTSTLGFID